LNFLIFDIPNQNPNINSIWVIKMYIQTTKTYKVMQSYNGDDEGQYPLKWIYKNIKYMLYWIYVVFIIETYLSNIKNNKILTDD